MESLTSGNERASYNEIHQRFVNSRYGEVIDGSIRFERFKPAHVSDEHWKELLGHDVDGLEHMPVTYGMTRAFIGSYNRYQDDNDGDHISPEDEHILLLAAMTNNWGEVRTGNISYDQVTTHHEQEEKDAYRKVSLSLLGDTVDIKTRMMVERTIFDQYSPLGRMFDSIKRAGYLRTGLQAFRESKTTDDEILKGHLQWLSANVLSNQMIALIEHSKTMSPIRDFLTTQKSLISEAFETIEPDVFSKHGQTQTIKAEQFQQNRQAWHEFGQPEADDLKLEIINTALRAATEERTPEEVTRNLEQLLAMYSRTVAKDTSQHGAKGENFDRGLFGTAANYEKRLVRDLDELKRKVEAIRELGLSIVLTSGSFDLLHIGHAAYLEKAKQHGDVLIVGVDSDERMQRKGPDRPIIPETERTKLLSFVRGVDLITVKQPSEEKWALIRAVQPDTLITTQETYTEGEIVDLSQHCQRIVTLPPQASTSTSAKIKRIQVGLSRKLQERTEAVMQEIMTSNADVPANELYAKVAESIEEILEELNTHE